MNKLRKILFPFSILYHGVTAFRNFLYEKDYIESTSFDIPIISVGNLNVGGTGKSPMIEYLISILKDEYNVAVLSRGYKRKTKGFLLVEKHHTVEEVGDEPLQFAHKFPNIIVAVDANRKRGIINLKDQVGVILLDDAFQHRKVKPSLSILLTSYADLYINDLILPAGNLRESSNGASRANIIVVTKCPEKLPYAKQQQIHFDLKPQPHQRVYFSTIVYATTIQGLIESKHIEYLENKKFVLVTGIANPKPMLDYLEGLKLKFDYYEYADHHEFSTSEISKLEEQKIILTTEKDFMRLKDKINKAELYYLPISVSFLNKEEGFIQRIKKAVAMIPEEDNSLEN